MTKPAQFTIRQAITDDVNAVVSLWNAAAEWLAANGQDQWQYPVTTNRIVSTIAAGHVWMIDDLTKPVATVTLDHFADPKLWNSEDNPDDALYAHRMVVSRATRNQHLGSAILDWASLKAKAEGKHWLRFDAWSTNTDLHRYYLDRGFHHVRTVTGADIISGVLFQREAGVTLGLGPKLIRSASPAVG